MLVNISFAGFLCLCVFQNGTNSMSWTTEPADKPFPLNSPICPQPCKVYGVWYSFKEIPVLIVLDHYVCFMQRIIRPSVMPDRPKSFLIQTGEDIIKRYHIGQ
jgi:hypothetical protein